MAIGRNGCSAHGIPASPGGLVAIRPTWLDCMGVGCIEDEAHFAVRLRREGLHMQALQSQLQELVR